MDEVDPRIKWSYVACVVTLENCDSFQYNFFERRIVEEHMFKQKEEKLYFFFFLLRIYLSFEKFKYDYFDIYIRNTQFYI